MHVTESLEFGGAEKVIVSLANAVATTNDVTVCCLKRVGDLASQLDQRVKVLCLDKGEGNDPAVILKLSRIIRDTGVDVLHTHDWGVFLESGLAAMVRRKVVCVHTVHGPYMSYGSGVAARLKRTLRHFLEKWVALRFSCICPVSDMIGEYIISDIGIPRKRVSTVHNGIEQGGGEPIAQGAHGDKPIRLIAVGRLAAVKNYSLLLRAVAKLRQKQPGVELVMVGDGPLRAQLERETASLGLQDLVRFTGFCDQVDQLLGQADIFVVSSDYEGISIAMLEAMRAGLPVIATRVGGVPETVVDGETGWLVPPADEAALAGAISTLAADAACRKRMGLAGRDRVRQEFSVDAMLKKYSTIYRDGRCACLEN